MKNRLLPVAIAVLLLCSPAFADDFDDFDDFDEPEGETETEIDEDPEALYNDYLNAAAVLDSESEIALWTDFVRDYPDNPHVDDAKARLKELEADLYDMGDEPDVELDDGPNLQAKDAEIPLVHPQAFYSANPRSTANIRLRIGADGHLGYDLGFEYGILRQLSAFGNLNNRRRSGASIGLNLELGAKYALVKSANRSLAVSVGGAFHVGYDSTSLFRAGFMPFVLAGWAPSDKAQIQAMFGMDLLFTLVGFPNYHAGLQGSFRFTPTIGLSVETTLRARVRNHDGVYGTFPGKATNSFVFAEGSVGLMIYPWKDRKTKQDRMELRVGVSIPYVVSYWRDYNPIGIDLGLAVYVPKKKS